MDGRMDEWIDEREEIARKKKETRSTSCRSEIKMIGIDLTTYRIVVVDQHLAGAAAPLP